MKLMQLVLFSVSVLAASCGGGGGSDGPGKPNTHGDGSSVYAICADDGDCTDATCDFGHCMTGCVESTDCGAGQECVGGNLDATSVCRVACVSDGDCGSADCCLEGLCAADNTCSHRDASPTYASCWQDTDCTDGGTCFGGYCISMCSEDPCPTGTACVDGQACQKECETSADCGGNDCCSEGACFPGGWCDSAWTCAPTYRGTGDGCDCGCGSPDPDCDGPSCSGEGCDATGTVCDFCSNDATGCPDGGGGGYGCETNDDCDPGEVCNEGACETPGPDGWTCQGNYYGDGFCDCGCGIEDSDCATPTGCTAEGCDAYGTICAFCYNGAINCGAECLTATDCTDGKECVEGKCKIPVPAEWTCVAGYFGTGDGCDCGCGVADPDCEGGAVCVDAGCDATGTVCGYCYNDAINCPSAPGF